MSKQETGWECEDETRIQICRQISISPFLGLRVVSAMLPLYHLPAPTSISFALSKTLNPIFPIPTIHPLAFSILCPPSHSNFPLPHRNSFSISRRNFSRESSGSANCEEEYQGLEEFEDEDQNDYLDGDNYDVDVTALEEEAKDAVLEYSSSLSSILRIGEYSDPSNWIFAFIQFVSDIVERRDKLWYHKRNIEEKRREWNSVIVLDEWIIQYIHLRGGCSGVTDWTS